MTQYVVRNGLWIALLKQRREKYIAKQNELRYLKKDKQNAIVGLTTSERSYPLSILLIY